MKNKLKQFWLVFICLAFGFDTHGQAVPLARIYEKYGSDSTLNYLYGFAFQADSAQVYGQIKAFDLYFAAKQLPNKMTLELQMFDAFYTQISLNNLKSAISKYKRVVTQAENQANISVQASALVELASCYEKTNKLGWAYEYYYRAEKAFEEATKPKAFRAYDRRRLFIVQFFYLIADYEQTIVYGKAALAVSHTEEDIWARLNLLNLVALAYENQYDMANAQVYHQATLDYAIKKKYPAWIGISYGNLGTIALAKGDLATAQQLFNKDYEIGLATRGFSTASVAQRKLATISLLRKNTTLAKKQLDEAKRMAKMEALNPNQEAQRYEHIVPVEIKWYEAMGDFKTAFGLKVQIDSLLKQKEDRNNAFRFQKIEAKLEGEKYRLKAQKLERQEANTLWQRNMMIFLMFLGMGFAYRWYKTNKQKQEQIEQKLLAEKQAIETKQHLAEARLAEYVAKARWKGDWIDSLLTEENDRPSNESLTQDYDKLAKSVILTEDHWLEFKELFEQIHPHFFNRLKTALPLLTPAETRMLALIKINLSNKEMAMMLGVSGDTIKKTKQRLRKKLDLSRDFATENLSF